MKSSLFSRKSLSIVFSLVAVLSLLMVAASPALAMSTDPYAMSGAKSDPQSEQLFHHAITVYSATLKTRIFENNSTDQAMQYIRSRDNGGSGGSGRGYKSFTRNQFASLYAAMSQVNAIMSLIKSMMIAHPGFDKYGMVTNSAVAANMAKDIDTYAKTLQYYAVKANSLYIALQHTR